MVSRRPCPSALRALSDGVEDPPTHRVGLDVPPKFPEPHLKLIGDLMEYVDTNVPAYKPLSVSGYHIREAGSTAAQELAFTLADGFGYVELGLSPRRAPRNRRSAAVGHVTATRKRRPRRTSVGATS